MIFVKVAFRHPPVFKSLGRPRGALPVRCSVKGEGLVVLPPPTQDRWAPLAPGHFLRYSFDDRGGQSGQLV